MKQILLSTALILAAGSAFSMTTHSDLTGPARAEAQSLVPNGDFNGLTTAQVNAIEAILYGGDTNRGAQIRAVLN